MRHSSNYQELVRIFAGSFVDVHATDTCDSMIKRNNFNYSHMNLMNKPHTYNRMKGSTEI